MWTPPRTTARKRPMLLPRLNGTVTHGTLAPFELTNLTALSISTQPCLGSCGVRFVQVYPVRVDACWRLPDAGCVTCRCAVCLPAFKSPCTKPTLVLVCAIVAAGGLAGVSLLTQKISAAYQAGIATPEFVVNGDHGPEMQLIILGIVMNVAFSFLYAFSSWLGYVSMPGFAQSRMHSPHDYVDVADTLWLWAGSRQVVGLYWQEQLVGEFHAVYFASKTMYAANKMVPSLDNMDQVRRYASVTLLHVQLSQRRSRDSVHGRL